nr:septal ring lytic transglycosylase RlpA family protein [Methylobacterium nonmethylotrophicum]
MTVAAISGAAAKSNLRQQAGVASWYGPGFHGRKTANGERFSTHALTAAHRNLPFGTQVRVTNNTNGRSVVVRINDRGLYVGGRVIDLSNAAARAIGVSGLAKVSLARL